jgi:hypothetical protein
MLKCDSCGKRIEELSEDEAIDDLPGHGWTNYQTAHSCKCFDCASDNDDYETYYAGRIKRGHPGKVFMMCPDIKGNNPDKLIECYSQSTKEVK